MKFSIRTSLVHSVALTAIGTLQADEEPSPDRLLKEWAATWQTGDVDKMMAHYDSAKETTAIESLGTIRQGPAEIREMYEEAFEELDFDRVELTPIAKGGNDSAAWATCRYKAEVRLKAGSGKRLVLEVLGSFVMHKKDGQWKIVMEHFSTIPDVPRVRPADE